MTVLRDYAARLSQPALDGEMHRRDEVVGDDGALRGPWKRLAELVVGLTADDLRRVDAEVVRMLADDGVTYARPGRRPSPWRLDPVPLVLDATAWTRLEVGLAQRTELLNAVLVDLYGEQRLLADGVVPAAAVLAHPGFARVVARPGHDDPRPLLLAGADLGRDAAGEWRVLADRAQAPSGLGYAVENRRVTARVVPELHREAAPHRLEPFVAALRTALLGSAPGDPPDPRVVLLSPGISSETAYDQAFLAQLLGFPLVQGSDLVVRDGWLRMRAFGRLERVDVVLRRVDAAWSDPLELRGDSRLGVAGLAEVVRRGRVRVVNGLGAGVLENPALLPYLPAACRRLLGEPLRLPSVPTWWCGEAAGLETVLDRLDELAVHSLDGAPLGGGTRDELVERLIAAPYRFVGQERLPLSQAPTWQAGGAAPHPLTLRTFTLRHGSTYRPLVGGLASVVDDGRAVSSKDVWVLKDDPTAPDQGLADVLPATSVRATTAPVPRVLEDMYWFGRYAERSEDLLRLVLAAHALAEEFRARPRSAGGTGLEVLLGAVSRLAGRVDDDLDREFRSVLLDAARPGSVAHALVGLRGALEGVRDQLSPDTWRAFGVTDRAVQALHESDHAHQVADSAGRMLTGILSLQGVTASMIRDAGWHMVAVGRGLERAAQLCHLLAATTTVRRGLDTDRQVLDAVLVAAESAVTHRRRYRGSVRTGGVLELLLMEHTNPRSLAASLAEVSDHLAALPASTGSTRPERLVADVRTELAVTDVATLVAIGGEGRPNLAAFLDRFQAHVARIAEAVADVHLSTGPVPRALGLVALRTTDGGAT